jgi:hypothetical protein
MAFLGGKGRLFQKLSFGSETWHEALSNKNMRILHPKKYGGPPTPALCYNWADKGGYFQKLSYGSETSDMTSEGLVEMLEGDTADTCARKFPGARTPRGVSGNSYYFCSGLMVSRLPFHI